MSADESNVNSRSCDEGSELEEADAEPSSFETYSAFPLDEYKKFQDGLSRITSWIVYPGSLDKCLDACAAITKDKSSSFR